MNHRTRAPTLAVAVLVGAAAIAGCSGGGSPKSGAGPATTLSVTALSQRYFALVAPVNTALQNFTVPRSASGAGRAQLAAPLISALSTLDQALPRVAWPARMSRDIDGLIAADKALESDLGNAADQTTEQVPAWESRLHTDGTKLDAAVNAVLVDLGQPPLPTTSTTARRATPPTS